MTRVKDVRDRTAAACGQAHDPNMEAALPQTFIGERK